MSSSDMIPQGTGRTSRVREGDDRLVVVGAASRDVDPGDPRGWRLGGGVTYGALAAARLGARVTAVIGLDAEAADADELAFLTEAGVDVRPVPLATGPVFEMSETDAARTLVLHEVPQPIDPLRTPDDLMDAATWLLTPVAGELDDRWAGVPSQDALVALSWQGLLRRLVAGAPVTPEPPVATALPRRADLAGVSVEDLPEDTPLDRLMTRDRQELVITRGARGAIHALRDEAGAIRMRALPAFASDAVVDRVGAGDVFLAAWLVARMPRGPFALAPSRALRLATALASLHVERPGLDGVPRREELLRRLARAARS